MSSEDIRKIGIGSVVPEYTGGINSHRLCNLWLGKYSERNSGRHSNSWKSSKNNTLGIEVNENIPLILDSDSLSISFENSFADGKDAIPSSVNGFAEKASKFLEQAAYLGNTNPEIGKWTGTNAIKRASKFDAPKVWSGTSSIKVEGDLTFKFSFGCGGLFDAKEEVVKPIYVLASLFAPKEVSKRGKSWIEPPLPTMGEWGARYLTSMVSSIIDTGKGIVDDIKSNLPTSTPEGEEVHTEEPKADQIFEGDLLDGTLQGLSQSAFSTAVNIRNEFFDSLHKGSEDVLNDGGYFNSTSLNSYAIAYMDIGNFKMGPFTVSSIKIDFDMKLLDENGWPSTGKITLGGVSSYVTATDAELLNTAKGLK